jgi:phosphate transport system substrate-binding protein
MPTVASIEDGTYAPFSRPLFIYVSKASAERPEVKAFIDFYLAQVGSLAGEVGYVKFPDAIYAKVRANWAARRTGSQFIDEKGDHVTGSLAEFYK